MGKSRLLTALALSLCLIMAGLLVGCGGGGGAGGGATATSGGGGAGGDTGTTSGPAFSAPSMPLMSSFNEGAAAVFQGGDVAIDTSQAPEGYVGARATAASRCKLQVVCGDMSYNYDLPADGSPIIVPLNMGSGTYQVRVMQNTSGTSYAEIASTTVNASLESDFVPYLRPNVFCNYNANSACVAKAKELTSGAENEGDVVRAIYDWMSTNITYDDAKAAELATTSGYVPNPDETLASKSGICFDYASLAAAMFRSLGIPCQVITGYVSPNDIYHAWNMIYINGQWISARITVEDNQWCRVDLTFAATAGQNGASSATVGDGTGYTDRYVY